MLTEREEVSPALCTLSFQRLHWILFSRADSPLLSLQPGPSLFLTPGLTQFLKERKITATPSISYSANRAALLWGSPARRQARLPEWPSLSPSTAPCLPLGEEGSARLRSGTLAALPRLAPRRTPCCWQKRQKRAVTEMKPGSRWARGTCCGTLRTGSNTLQCNSAGTPLLALIFQFCLRC